MEDHNANNMLPTIIDASILSLAVNDTATEDNSASPLKGNPEHSQNELPDDKQPQDSPTVHDLCELAINNVVAASIKNEAIDTIWSNMQHLRSSTKTLAVWLRSKDATKIALITDDYWCNAQRILWALNSVHDHKLMYVLLLQSKCNADIP